MLPPLATTDGWMVNGFRLGVVLLPSAVFGMFWYILPQEADALKLQTLAYLSGHLHKYTFVFCSRHSLIIPFSKLFHISFMKVQVLFLHVKTNTACC